MQRRLLRWLTDWLRWLTDWRRVRGCVQLDILDLLFPTDDFQKQKEVSRALIVDIFTESLNEKPLVPQLHGIANVSGPFEDPKAPYSLTGEYSTEELLQIELPDPAKGDPRSGRRAGSLSDGGPCRVPSQSGRQAVC
jgi:hypothetical protein